MENSIIFVAKVKLPVERESLLFVADCYCVVYEQ